MINHFRTLLLNEAAASVFLTMLGSFSRLVDPTFGKVSLPPGLQSLYDVLFPSADILCKQGLVHAYLSLIKSVGLEDAILALDPRVTYNISEEDQLFSAGFCSHGIPLLENTLLSGIGARTFNYGFIPAATDFTPNLDLFIWQYASENSVQVINNNEDVIMPITGLSFTDNFSQTLSVYNPANLKNKMFDFIIDMRNNTANFDASDWKLWQVKLNYPAKSLLHGRSVAARAAKGVIDTVLAKYPGPPDSSNFDRLWQQHPNWNYQLAGLVISLVYRMNALRT